MNKKFVIFICIALCVILFATMYLHNSLTIDTKCAQKFAYVLNSYNINEMDNYLDETTEIIFMGQKDVYKNCRNNVISAFNEKNYAIPQYGSYGYGNNKFENGTQKISVKLMGTFNDESIGECVINMSIQRDGLFGYKVQSIECDDAIFGHIFFGDYIL